MKKPIDQVLSGLPLIAANVNRAERWPNIDTTRRPRKIYRLLFSISATCTAVFLAAGGLSLVAAPPAAIALISLAGWSMAYAFAEGYRDGAKHAVDDATTLAEEAAKLPDEIGRELWTVMVPAGRGQGYVYVVEFETGAIKVGQSIDPIRRVDEHRRDAWAYNVVATNVWVSPPHRGYLTNEIQLMMAISKQLGGERAKREYFHDVDFQRVVEIARELAARPTPARLRRPSAEQATQPTPAS